MTETLLLDEIERSADDMRSRFELGGPEGEGDVVALVAHLGGEIEMRFDAPERPESLQVRTPSDFTVIVPWNTSMVRDRSTTAHELGHLRLHYQDGAGARSFYRYGRDRQESEANAFAAALLMPSDAF